MVSIVKKIATKILRLHKEEDWRNEIPTPLRKWLPQHKPLTLIDVGAHEGDFTRALSRQYPISTALLVEALPNKAAELRAEFNPPQFIVEECAASSAEGSVEFEMNALEKTSSLLKIRRDMPELAALDLSGSRRMRVRARTLDQLAAGLKEIDLIKIDVQGAELLVLSGARATLSRTRLILTEVSFKPLYENSPTFTDVYAKLDQSGFGLAELISGFRGENRELLQGDALFFKK